MYIATKDFESLAYRLHLCFYRREYRYSRITKPPHPMGTYTLSSGGKVFFHLSHRGYGSAFLSLLLLATRENGLIFHVDEAVENTFHF